MTGPFGRAVPSAVSGGGSGAAASAVPAAASADVPLPVPAAVPSLLPGLTPDLLPAARGGRPVGAVCVVVPVHDEQELLGRCIAALRHAVAHEAARPGAVRVEVVLVLDGCTDASGAIARLSPFRVVEVSERRVGAARAVGVDVALAALRESTTAHDGLAATGPHDGLAATGPHDGLAATGPHAGRAGTGADGGPVAPAAHDDAFGAATPASPRSAVPPLDRVRPSLDQVPLPLDQVWIASTDADSAVPPHWISSQVDLAAAGADVVVGTVRPDPADLSPDQRDAWQTSHVPGQANGHVHGANLGMRADVYVRAGGYPPLDEHEDVSLVARARDAGGRVVASDDASVLTSGRQQGRTPGGYARFLREDLVGGLPS